MNLHCHYVHQLSLYSQEEVLKRQEVCGMNESVAKRTHFIPVLLKKFIGPVEIILELLALYFFVVAPFISQIPSGSPPSPPPPVDNNSSSSPSFVEVSPSSTAILVPETDVPESRSEFPC